MELGTIKFDFDKISAQDIWDFEERSGGVDLMMFATDLEKKKVNGSNFLQYLRPIVALAWISARQSDPDLQFETIARQPMASLFGSVEVVKRSTPEASPMTKPISAADRRKARSAAATASSDS